MCLLNQTIAVCNWDHELVMTVWFSAIQDTGKQEEVECYIDEGGAVAI